VTFCSDDLAIVEQAKSCVFRSAKA